MLQLKEIRKEYKTGDLEQVALNDVSLNLRDNEFVAILGPSGSGKTTFLRCLNFLETTDSGTLIFDGEQFDLGKITKADIARLRKKTAFVFQNYNLFRNKTALQNVTEGLVIARKMPKAQADAIGMKMLEKVGLADRFLPPPALRRPAAAGGHCPGSCHRPGNSLF